MKTKITLLAFALLCVTSAFSQPFADAEYVKDWNHTLNGAKWFGFNKPVVGQDVDAAVVKKTAVAVSKTGLAPATLDFDAVYATLGAANVFQSKANGGVNLERPWNDISTTDFVGEWKAAYDDSYLYIFIKYDDDIDTGGESVEVMWSNAFKIDAPDTITTAGNNNALNQKDSMALFYRYAQFGGYKAAFTVADGFKQALVLTGGARTAVAPLVANSYADGQKPAILVDNLAFFNKTNPSTPLSKKHIIKIGFPAFTGEARPDFNNDIWNTLNNNRGLSFEVTVKDLDGDEVIDPAKPTSTKKEAAGYFWNNAKSDVWGTNAYAGFLKNDVVPAPAYADAEYVKDWNHTLNGATWFGFKKPIVGQDVDAAVVKKTAVAVPANGLAPATLDFDAVYPTLGTANVFQSKANGGVNLERPWNDISTTDFVGEWKAAFDDSFLYLFVKYDDDIDTGGESVEVMWSNAFKIDAPDTITTAGNDKVLTQKDSMALFYRYAQFGGYKAAFTVADGFKQALVLTGGARTAVAPLVANSYADGQKPAILVDNLAFFNKTNPATPLSKKHIIKIGFPAFTGEARPDFNNDIWNTLNNNRGLSFEVTVKDLDGDEVIDPAKPTSTKKEAAGYFWNNAKSDVWGTNAYAGFLKNDMTSGLINTYGTKNSIFATVTPSRIDLNSNAKVLVFDALGKSVISINNTNVVNLSALSKGIYIVRANDEVVKIVR